MSPLAPREPSTAPEHASSANALSRWVECARTTDELMKLLREAQGVPTAWLVWAAQEANRCAERGVEVRHGAAYRAQVLRSGVERLSATRRPCERTETALRAGVEERLRDCGLHLGEIAVGTPHLGGRSAKSMTMRLAALAETSRASESVVWTRYALGLLTLGQLLDVVVHHWRVLRVGGKPSGRPGFRRLF